ITLSTIRPGIDDDVVAVVAAGPVEAPAAGDQPQDRLAGLVPDALDRQGLLGSPLDPLHQERPGRSPVLPDHDPVARAELAEPEEHRRPGTGVDVPDDHRRPSLPGPGPELVPAGPVDLGHLHRPVRLQPDRHHPCLDPGRGAVSRSLAARVEGAASASGWAAGRWHPTRTMQPTSRTPAHRPGVRDTRQGVRAGTVRTPLVGELGWLEVTGRSWPRRGAGGRSR